MAKNTADTIIIRGAKVNNLKNVSIDLPRNKMIVITGLSGSGKSSFAFDTLYAEGQRRYVESLSSYARQFMGKMTKPAVDLIKGIPPAIAIEQRVISRNARSTVGTATEIYEYLKLLFARVGHTYSPISGEEVTCSFVSDVVDAVKKLNEATRIMICFPLVLRHERNTAEELDVLTKQGFTRLWINNELHRIDEPKIDKQKNIAVLVDRLRVSSGEDFQNRLTDSVQTAFSEGEGKCLLLVNTAEDTWEVLPFSNRFEKDGIVFEDPTPNLFSFNSPIGACPECEGYGSVIGIDPDLVIPDKRLSVYEGAVVCWHGDKMSKWKDHVVMGAAKCDFPIHKPIEDLNKEQYNMLWKGTPYFHGINDFFEWVETQQYKVQYRVMLSRYRGKTVCPTCEGSRLRKEALYVKVGGKNIAELCEMPVSDLKVFFENLQFQSAAETTIAKTLLTEVRNRLQFLEDVGLGYLTLNRPANTLSGGESQRINLSNALGSSLVGSIYILDEPSIGLHPRD
ncbi:MAG: excinuclease ABC subunit A, partial [Bacteroidales bacterium]|nr:excinuclease ABC subunit A [Bacteroidales bacterium]